VKGILDTAQVYANYDVLTQGAGFVNTLGAVRLAKFYMTRGPATAFRRRRSGAAT
jgi:hypothetical protein